MSNELEDFLARILQGNAQNKPKRTLPPRPVAPHPEGGRPHQITPRADVDDLQVLSAEVVPEKAVSADASQPRRLRSTTDLSTSDVSQHADQLGHKFDHPKKSGVGAHVKSHYDHQVGRLVSTAFDPNALPDAAAEGGPVDILEQIMKMMQTPQGLRQAVILQEILARPEHRW